MSFRLRGDFVSARLHARERIIFIGLARLAQFAHAHIAPSTQIKDQSLYLSQVRRLS